MNYNQPFFEKQRVTNGIDQHADNLIKVTGEGVVTVTPDQAIVTLGVVKEDPSLQKAQAQNAQTTTNVINALVANGIPKDQIRTVDYSIIMQYDFNDGQQVFRGYRVNHMLQITINDIEQTGKIVDIAVDNGANTVTNIQMTVENVDPYYNQALTLAVQDAHQKATTLARAIGVTINAAPQQIQEITQPQPPQPYQSQVVLSAQAGGQTTPIEPGQLQVTARIRADYSY